MDRGPHILAELLLREGQQAFVDVALVGRADRTAFEVCCRGDDGSYAPVLVIDALQQDQLRTAGHCTPRMVWGTLDPLLMPARLLTFVAPHAGVYAVTQEYGIGTRQPTITASISVKNGFAEKFRRLVGQSRRAISRLSTSRSAG